MFSRFSVVSLANSITQHTSQKQERSNERSKRSTRNGSNDEDSGVRRSVKMDQDAQSAAVGDSRSPSADPSLSSKVSMIAFTGNGNGFDFNWLGMARFRI
nr:hypothetical protein B0A51_09158 [Rachicladosporium sp. CCFEE 5018]